MYRPRSPLRQEGGVHAIWTRSGHKPPQIACRKADEVEDLEAIGRTVTDCSSVLWDRIAHSSDLRHLVAIRPYWIFAGCYRRANARGNCPDSTANSRSTFHPNPVGKPPRDCRRLQILRGCSHGQAKHEVLAGGSGAGCAVGGLEPQGRIRLRRLEPAARRGPRPVRCLLFFGLTALIVPTPCCRVLPGFRSPGPRGRRFRQ
jgi:hypothetical protein